MESAALFLALAAVLLQPKRDPEGPASWRNLSASGQLLLVVIIFVGVLKIGKVIHDSAVQQAERDSHVREVKQLNDSLADLRDTNKHLIKVMSVADGYNALVSGTVVFTRPVSENQIRETCENLFLKYALIVLEARNKLGVYYGRVDYGVQPTLWKYRRLSEIEASPELLKLKAAVPDTALDRAYYFELRCAHLKILNGEKVQYVRFARTDTMNADVMVLPQWPDFQRLYPVDQVYLEKVTIEELGDMPIRRRLSSDED